MARRVAPRRVVLVDADTLTRVDWFGTVSAAVVSWAVIGSVSWWAGYRRASHERPQWRLEHVRGETWTLKRLAKHRALDVVLIMANEYGSPGFDAKEWSSRARIDNAGRIRVDMDHADVSGVVNVSHGMLLTLTWIESDTRFRTDVQTRVGTDVYTVTPRDVAQQR